jgi:hypothetical protein
MEYFLPCSPTVIGDQLRQLFPSKRINAQTIAKLCMVIGEAFLIAQKQKHGNNCFSVSNAWAENILSRLVGRRPLAILDILGLTTIKRKHRSTICPASTVRQFVHSSFKPYRLYLIGIAARESSNLGKRGKLRREADPNYAWVQKSMERASLPSDTLAAYQEQPKHTCNAAKFEQGLRQQGWRGSFRWNSVCQMPPDIRKQLIFDAETPVTRLDISCSFGILLPWLFSDESENLAKKRMVDLEEQHRRLVECNSLRIFLSSGDFYRSLADGLGRNDAKGAFQRYLNATKPDGLAKSIGGRFADKFRKVDAMIRRRRGSPSKSKEKRGRARHHTTFTELQGRQNEVIQAVVKKCREDAIPCIPVWDELIVPFQNRMQVLNWLHDELYEKTGVSAKVGGIRRSSVETKIVPCPPGLCPHCWNVRIVTNLTTPFPCAHLESKLTSPMMIQAPILTVDGSSLKSA